MVTIFLLKMLVREVCLTNGSNDRGGVRLRSRMIDLTAMIMCATRVVSRFQINFGRIIFRAKSERPRFVDNDWLDGERGVTLPISR